MYAWIADANIDSSSDSAEVSSPSKNADRAAASANPSTSEACLEAVEDSRVDEASVRICDILFDHGYVDGFEGVTIEGATFEGMTFESVTPDAQDTGGERGAGDV